MHCTTLFEITPMDTPVRGCSMNTSPATEEKHRRNRTGHKQRARVRAHSRARGGDRSFGGADRRKARAVYDAPIPRNIFEMDSERQTKSMSHLRSRMKPRDTRPNLDHQCELMSRTEIHAPLTITKRTTRHATRPPTRPRVWCVCGVCARFRHLFCVFASVSGVPLAFARLECLPASGDDLSCLLGCPFAFGCLHNTRHDGLGLTSCIGRRRFGSSCSFFPDCLNDFFFNVLCSIPVGPMRSIWADLGGVWLP